MRRRARSITCFIIGEGQLLIDCARILLDQGHTVRGILTKDPLVQRWAAREETPLLSIEGDLAAILSGEPFDYLFSIANYRILSPEVLAIPGKATINYHDAPLPRYGGVNAVSWALINQEKSHGVTWHVVSPRVDAGDILEQRIFSIDAAETALTLNTKTFEAAIDAFTDLITDLCRGTLSPVAQNPNERTFNLASRRPAAAGIVSWDRPACEIDALVRATDFGPYLNPFASAKIAIGGQIVVAAQVRVLGDSNQPPGTVVAIHSDRLVVATADLDVAVLQVASVDGEPIPIADLVTRHGVSEGARLPALGTDLAKQITAANKSIVRHEPFWVRRLEELSSASLPYLSCAPGPRHEARYARLSMALPEGVAEYLKTSGRSGLVAETVVAAFGAYLARVGAGARFDIGFMEAAPDRPGIDGLFAQYVPFRFEIDLAAGIGEAAASVRKELERVRARETYLQDAVARHPSLRTGRVGLEIAVALTAGPSTCQPMPGTACTLAFDPVCGDCCWIYDTAALAPDAVSAMQGHFARLLGSISQSPSQNLDRQSILSDSERYSLLVQRNQTEPLPLQERTIPEVFEEQVLRTPDNVSVVCEGRSVTYAELNSRANQLAHALGGQGVGPETLVGVFVERSVEMIVALLGVLKAGGAYVPLDPSYPADRVRSMLADSRAPVIVTQSRLMDRLPDDIARILCLDNTHVLDRESRENPKLALSPDNAAYVIFTSGSTGRPKGVQISHFQVPKLVETLHARVGSEAGDAWTVFHSYAFDFSVWEIWSPLLSGGKLVVVPPEAAHSPAQLHALLAREAVTILNITPSALSALLSYEDEAGNSRHELSLRMLHVGGEALTRETAARALDWGLPLWNFYGPTESTVWATLKKIDRDDISLPIAGIGGPFAGREVYILDSALEPVPGGVAGELCIGGAGLARGYLNRPELTAEKFVPDPFAAQPGSRLYRTGDLCRYRPDGHIEYLSRIDQMVKIRGFRIELGEIESAVLSHGSVQGAAVIDREDAAGGASLVAYIVPRGGSLDTASLRGHLRAVLPEYMMPAAFVLLEALPLSPNGKLDRKALPPPESEEPVYAAPQNPIEEGLAEIWGQVLRRDRVGIHDNFFEIGGHSLLATQVISRIRTRFDIDLPMPILFDTPTIAELAQRVDAAKTEKSSSLPPIVPVPRDRPLPLSFAQQRLWYVSQIDRVNPGYNVLYPLRVCGDLNVAALEKAIRDLVERHEVLRTRYVEIVGVPAQIVGFSYNALEVLAVDGITLEERRDLATRHAIQRLSLPLDLGSDQGLRAILFRVGPREHLLALIMHHITSDGWTLALITKELAALYSAFVAGERSPLPDLAIQYADYAAWQRACMETGVVAGQVEYWKRQLEGAPQTSKLPQDRPHPPTRNLRGADVNARIDHVNTERLLSLCRKEGGTLFMALLASFNVLLGYVTNEQDIVVGTDTTGRDRTELEGLAGCFVNHVVLRNDLAGDPRFSDLLRRVRRVSLDAFAHQDVPFDRLVELLRPQRDPAYTPLFQILFVMQDVPSFAIDEGDLSLEFVPVPASTSKYDLSLFCFRQAQDGRESVLLQWTYNTDIFDSATIRRLVDQFDEIVSVVAPDPDTKLSEIKMALDLSAASQETQQQERRQAASYARFQQMKPRSLK